MTPTVHPLRVKRILKGQTQWDVANASGVNQTKISLIETGRITNISKEEQMKLAQALDEKPDELFPEKEASQCA